MTAAAERGRQSVLDGALRHLRDAGLRVIKSSRPRSTDGPDAVLDLAGPGGGERYAVYIKSRVSPGSVATIQHPQRGRVLIVAPHVPDAVGESLRQRDVNYVDVAGNAYVTWTGMLLDVRGRKRLEVARPAGPGRPLRAFRANGLQIMFVLLADPSAVSSTYRQIAQASGTSLGTVQWVLKELAESGYVASEARRKLYRRRDLFNRWVEAYGLDLEPRLTLARFDAADPTWWTRADPSMHLAGAQWGGETAAHRTYARLRPSRATVYATSIPTRLAAEFRFHRTDGPGTIEVRERFWHLREETTDIVVPSPLIYADLIASGDPRQGEAAAHLREHDALLRHIDGD